MLRLLRATCADSWDFYPWFRLLLLTDFIVIMLMKHYVRPTTCAIVDALSFKLICVYLDYYDKVSVGRPIITVSYS